MAESERIRRHPALPFHVVKYDRESGIVYIAVEGNGIEHAAPIKASKLLELPEVLARLPERQRAEVVDLARGLPTRPRVTVREELEMDHAAYEAIRESRFVETCTVYTGMKEYLIALGVATCDQFPSGENGTQYWSKSGGYKDSKRNPSQRWSVRRHHLAGERDLFDVYRWHEPRPVKAGFERFMRQALRPSG